MADRIRKGGKSRINVPEREKVRPATTLLFSLFFFVTPVAQAMRRILFSRK